MKRYGFYCRMYGKDCFFETDHTKRTKKMAMDFINKVQNRMNRFNNINDADIEHVQNAMRFATFEIKTIENGAFVGKKYYEINGENFSYGCDPCTDPTEYYILVH